MFACFCQITLVNGKRVGLDDPGMAFCVGFIRWFLRVCVFYKCNGILAFQGYGFHGFKCIVNTNIM